MARTMSGNAITAEASAAPVQRKANTIPVDFREQPTERPVPAEQQQQDIASDHRRQNERQVNAHIEDLPAPEPSARERHRGQNAKRQARHDRPCRDFEAQMNGNQFGRGELEER